MRICPPGVPEWESVYDSVVDAMPDFETRWMMGQAKMTDLIVPLAERLPMTNAAIARHLRNVWVETRWFPASRVWVERLNGVVLQALVTVNPHEMHGIGTAVGLDPLIDVVVTSAELQTESKVAMADHARELLGLGAGLATTLLIDNRSDNCDAFDSAGGRSYCYEPTAFERDAHALLGSLVD